MEMKVKFSQRFVDKLKFSPRITGVTSDGYVEETVPDNVHDYFISDAAVQGFQIRLTRAGTKTYYVVKKINNKRCRFKIGSCDSIDLDSTPGKKDRGARSIAREAFGLMEQGIDPNLRRSELIASEEKAKANRKYTFGMAFEEYHNPIEFQKNNNPEKTSTDNKIDVVKPPFAETTQKDHIKIIKWMKDSVLWKTPFTEVTSQIIEASLAPFYKATVNQLTKLPKVRTTSGNQTFRYCRAAWNFRVKKYKIKGLDNPFVEWVDDFKHVQKINRRQNYLPTQSDIGKKWLQTIASKRKDKSFSHRVISDYVLLCLLWGSRRNEPLSLKWEHIDWDKMSVAFLDTKSRANPDHYIPLTPLAKEILLARYEDNKKPNWRGQPRNHGDWVFPSRQSGKHMVEPRGVLKLANGTTNLNLGIHDLRRTVAGELLSHNDAFIVKMSLNHADVEHDVTAGYIIPKLNLLRPVFEKREKWLFELAGIADDLNGN